MVIGESSTGKRFTTGMFQRKHVVGSKFVVEARKTYEFAYAAAKLKKPLKVIFRSGESPAYRERIDVYINPAGDAGRGMIPMHLGCLAKNEVSKEIKELLGDKGYASITMRLEAIAGTYQDMTAN